MSVAPVTTKSCADAQDIGQHQKSHGHTRVKLLTEAIQIGLMVVSRSRLQSGAMCGFLSPTQPRSVLISVAPVII